MRFVLIDIFWIDTSQEDQLIVHSAVPLSIQSPKSTWLPMKVYLGNKIFVLHIKSLFSVKQSIEGRRELIFQAEFYNNI